MKCVMYNKNERKNEYYPIVKEVYNGYCVVRLDDKVFDTEEYRLVRIYD